MAGTAISSCAFLFLIFTSLLFHHLFAAPIFAHPPAQDPAFAPSPPPAPGPAVPTSKPPPPSPPPPPPQSSNPVPPPPPPPPTGSGGNVPPSKKKSGLSGGQTAGVVIGVLAALGLLGLGSLVYKKRQYNIRRSRYGSAARRASL